MTSTPTPTDLLGQDEPQRVTAARELLASLSGPLVLPAAAAGSSEQLHACIEGDVHAVRSLLGALQSGSAQ
jgi:hypothetical protein